MDGAHVVSSAGASDTQEEGKQVMVLAATNRPQDIDEALRRRLEKRIYIPLPSENGRLELFKINLRGTQTAPDINFDELVKKTKGYSGADIASVCREAAMLPLRKKLMDGSIDFSKLKDIDHSEIEIPISQSDFLEALSNIQRSVSNDHL